MFSSIEFIDDKKEHRICSNEDQYIVPVNSQFNTIFHLIVTLAKYTEQINFIVWYATEMVVLFDLCLQNTPTLKMKSIWKWRAGVAEWLKSLPFDHNLTA